MVVVLRALAQVRYVLTWKKRATPVQTGMARVVAARVDQPHVTLDPAVGGDRAVLIDLDDVGPSTLLHTTDTGHRVSIRLRHAYFDDAGKAHPLSQARFDRVMDAHIREPIPELAGKRVRFITLYVQFEDGLAIELVRVEASLVVFDDKGRDEADADRQLHAAASLLDDTIGLSTTSTVVPAAGSFQASGFRWKPTSEQVEAVIAAHRLRGD